jgi:hypothetical protein
MVVQTASPYFSAKINVCITGTNVSFGLTIILNCSRRLSWKSTKYKRNTLSDDKLNSLHMSEMS